MFRAGISEETLLSIPYIKGLSPEILLFKRKGTVSRDFSFRDGILPTPLRPPCRSRPKAGSKGHGRPQNLDESGRGPRRAVAKAVASPLGVQRSINITVFSSFNRPAARVIAAEKATPSARCYGRVPA